MRKCIPIVILCSLFFFVSHASAQSAVDPTASTKTIFGVINRMLPGKADAFKVEIIPSENGLDVFELESVGGKIVLRGRSVSAVLSGLNWYLKYYAKAHISWTGDQLNLPTTLPAVPSKVRIASPYKYRYIYNYCTFNYTMSFWTWKDWERELDFIAMNGVNVALASVIGQEALWQNFMKRLGFSDKEVFDFIPGPGFQAWWLMDNLEGWGGPVTQQWIDARADLQKKILGRMRELGIEPVMQGFFGMMPRSAITRFPDAGLIETGIWCRGFKRPPMIIPSSNRFAEFAKAWYEEESKLYGDARFYGGDPFHEGDIAAVNLKDVGVGIQKAMLESRPDSVWVLQGWQSNPNPQMISGLKKSNVLIINLHGESNEPQWKYRDGFRGYPWVWCIISNFGGKTGMHGSVGRVAREPIDAMSHYKKYLVGIGAIMEGSTMNDSLWDFLFEMGWHNTKPDLDKWFADYAERRYGKTTPGVQKAWGLLEETVYQSGGRYEEDPRSLFCSRPNDRIRTLVSGYGFGPYDPCKLPAAWKLMLDDANTFRGVGTFEYDLVDVTREYISNANILVHQKMIMAFRKKDKDEFEKYSSQFLEMLNDEDRLLGTNEHFLLGRWLESAKAWGATDAEKKLFEWNARTLITVWGERVASEGLDDYASREWAGTLGTYYYMRWKTYIDDLRAQLNSQPAKPIDWYGLEEPWTRSNESYPTHSAGDPIAESRRIYDKYSPVLSATCGQK